MIAIAGFDVGFSPTRTTCGIAVRDLSLVGRTVKRYGDVRAGAFRLADTRQVLSDLLSKAGGELVVVVDAPISADGPPTADRSVDSLCSLKGF